MLVKLPKAGQKTVNMANQLFSSNTNTKLNGVRFFKSLLVRFTKVLSRLDNIFN